MRTSPRPLSLTFFHIGATVLRGMEIRRLVGPFPLYAPARTRR